MSTASREYGFSELDPPEGPLPVEPDNCPKCGARRQWNVDGEIVHARAGSEDCPAVPFSEGPVQALLAVIRGEQCIHPGVFATHRTSEHCWTCDRDVPAEEL